MMELEVLIHDEHKTSFKRTGERQESMIHWYHLSIHLDIRLDFTSSTEMKESEEDLISLRKKKMPSIIIHVH
jgi:hypothetical protein